MSPYSMKFWSKIDVFYRYIISMTLIEISANIWKFMFENKWYKRPKFEYFFQIFDLSLKWQGKGQNKGTLLEDRTLTLLGTGTVSK